MRFGLSLMAGAILLAGPAAAADWKHLAFPDQVFVVESPVPLVKGTGTYQSVIVGRIPTVTYTGELDKIRYRVTTIDISKQPADAQNLFEEMESITEDQGKVLGNDDCVRLRIFEKEKALPQFEGTAIAQCAKIILHQSLHKFRL